MDWYDAARYCRWLSEQEGVPDEQMCFPPISQIKEGMKLPADYAQRTGYRLPTEAEWELACRAGALTSRYYGNTEELLGQYAWYLYNSKNNQSSPSASLKPNEFGLFDMLGNILEWNTEAYSNYPSSRRGGALEVADTKGLDDKQRAKSCFAWGVVQQSISERSLLLPQQQPTHEPKQHMWFPRGEDFVAVFTDGRARIRSFSNFRRMPSP